MFRRYENYSGLGLEPNASAVVGALIDASRGVPFKPELKVDRSEEIYVRQARIYGMKDADQQPFVGKVQVTGQKEASELPGVTVNFVNGGKTLSTES